MEAGQGNVRGIPEYPQAPLGPSHNRGRLLHALVITVSLWVTALSVITLIPFRSSLSKAPQKKVLVVTLSGAPLTADESAFPPPAISDVDDPTPIPDETPEEIASLSSKPGSASPKEEAPSTVGLSRAKAVSVAAVPTNAPADSQVDLGVGLPLIPEPEPPLPDLALPDAPIPEVTLPPEPSALPQGRSETFAPDPSSPVAVAPFKDLPEPPLEEQKESVQEDRASLSDGAGHGGAGAASPLVDAPRNDLGPKARDSSPVGPSTLSLIEGAIKKNLRYPPQARKRGITGRVELHIVVDSQGRLIECTVQSSSGSPILDEAATKLLKSIFPLQGATAISTRVGVEYRLD